MVDLIKANCAGAVVVALGQGRVVCDTGPPVEEGHGAGWKASHFVGDYFAVIHFHGFAEGLVQVDVRTGGRPGKRFCPEFVQPGIWVRGLMGSGCCRNGCDCCRQSECNDVKDQDSQG